MSIDYPLAKELKDAGFHQNDFERHADRYILPDGVSASIRYPESVYVPTLSELIEACGAGFGDLMRTVSMDERKEIMWVANPKHECLTGTTPEEAVARLWLALQKSKKEEEIVRELQRITEQ